MGLIQWYKNATSRTYTVSDVTDDTKGWGPLPVTATGMPASVGQLAPAASVSVVDATDTFTSPDNSIISVANTSTAIMAAAGEFVRVRKAILYNTGAQTVSIREGAAPTAGTHFPLVAGASLNVETLLAVNGIVASGTCNVAVLSEARS